MIIFQVSVEQSDGQELLLHKLGYSPTQYSLHLIPNSSLWAGLTQSTLTALSTSNHIAQKNIGTLLFEHDRHFSLVLAAKSEERDNDVIIEGEEYSTPKCDNLFHDVGESGYLTYHSSVATPVDDVIMTSCPQSKPTECAKLKAAKSEERDNDVIIEGEEYSTPKCGDNRFHDVGESGYSTYHSSVATPVDDVIMTSSLQSKPTTECAKLNESCSTIIVSDSEYEIEDPLPTKAPALPGLFSHRLHPQSVGEKSTFQPTSPYFLPPHQKRSSPAKVDISNPSSRCSQKQRGPTLRDKVVIIVSSSDEAELPSLTTSVGHQSSIRQESGRSPQSSDEGIVLDSRWEESRCSSGVDTPSVLGASSALTDEGQIHGEGQVLNKQKASDHTVVVKCGGYDLTLADLRTLEPHQWLNDQVSLLSFNI